MAPKIETPTDSPKSSSKSTGAVPQRGIRKRMWEEGDFLVMQIASDPDFPKGTLLLVPNSPKFETGTEARRWCESSSQDLLAGKQVMIIKVHEMGAANVISEPRVEMDWRPKVSVNKQTAETSE